MSNSGWKEDLARDIEAYTLGEEPSVFEMMRAPVIEDWTTEIRRLGKEFKLVVKGRARKHPDYDNGEDICTAAINWFDRKARFCRSAHRLYMLGQQAGEDIPVDGVDV
ncbi:hypothetical protein RAD16_32435 [Bradyrhizobium sp. 18BD]